MRLAQPSSARRLGLAALVGAIAASLVPAATALADGPPAGTLSVAPAHPDPANPATRAYFVHSSDAGSTWSDDVLVKNPGDQTTAADVYVVDGVTATQTGAVYADRATRPAKAATWVVPEVTSVSLAPHSQRLVHFTVAVPKDAAPGDHLAGIAFEAKRSQTTGGSFAVATIWRSVVGVLDKVSGPAAFHLHIASASITALPGAGTASIAVDMEDDGGLLAKPDLTITVSGPGGYHRTADHQLNTMLPGDRITDPIAWPDALGSGDYTVAVSASLDGVSVGTYSASAHLAADLEGSTPNRPATSPPAHSAGVPWLWILALVPEGIAALVLAWFLVIRRRRRGACGHCHIAAHNGRLIDVTTLDEMYGCRSCAKAVHNSGRVLLCPSCYKEHARRQLVR